MGWIKITPITKEAKEAMAKIETRLVHPGETAPPGWEFWYQTKVELASSIVGQIGGEDRSSRVDMSLVEREPIEAEMEVWRNI